MTRMLLTLGMLAAIGGCTLGKVLQLAGASTLGGAGGTLGSFIVSTLGGLAPTVI